MDILSWEREPVNVRTIGTLEKADNQFGVGSRY